MQQFSETSEIVKILKLALKDTPPAFKDAISTSLNSMDIKFGIHTDQAN